MSLVPIYAHRGASGHAIENTFAAFKKAQILGADGIEIDIQRTSDNQLVVFHDINLSRLTGIKKYIFNCSLEELQTYKLGSRFFRLFSSEHIPTLDEVLNWANEQQYPVNIELKQSLLEDPTVLATALLKMELPLNSHVSSFHEELLRLTKEIRPDIETALIATRFLNWMTLGDLPHIDAVHASKKYYGRKYLKACDYVGKGVRFYGIKGNEPYLKNPHPAVKGWITDYPAKVRKQQLKK